MCSATIRPANLRNSLGRQREIPRISMTDEVVVDVDVNLAAKSDNDATATTMSSTTTSARLS